MFGSHLSIAGSMLNALDEAQSLGLDALQVFTKNQQQWKSKPLDPALVHAWNARLADMGWLSPPSPSRLVSHASYLINLASPDDALWDKSIALMADEIDRCHTLNIPLLVHHPGAFTTSTRELGITRIAAAYKRILTLTPHCERVVSCIENTVGSGSNLGGTFADLAAIRDQILEQGWPKDRLGVCIDTCHAHAAGYPLVSAESAQACLKTLDSDLGIPWIRVFHINDSKAPAASKRDLHQHIGQGTMHLDAFAFILNSSGVADKPKIMETPKGTTPGGEPMDTMNLRVLKDLLSSPTAGPRSSPGNSKSPGSTSPRRTGTGAKLTRGSPKKVKDG